MNRGRLLLTLVGVIVLSAVPIARANIAPPTTLYLHVQPYDPDYCSFPYVQSCEDVVQTTDATGDVLFAVFMYSNAYDHIASIDFTARWDWSMGIWGIDQCAGAQITYEYYGDNQITVHLTWPECPILSWQPICVLGMSVYGDGCLSIDNGAAVRWGCPPGGWTENPIVGTAEAGVQCAYSCMLSCDPWDIVCAPALTPETLHFELVPGQTGMQTMQMAVSGGWPHDVSFDATEPWVALEMGNVEGHDADVKVTVDATGLTPGDYSAVAHASCDGRDCGTITLTVLDNSQSIPDGLPPGRAGPTTWGGIKNLYR